MVVFDPDEGKRRADDGLARAERGRDELCDRMDDAVRAACERSLLVCADQVWLELGEIPASKGAASALGGAMRRAVRDGIMQRTGEFRLSERPVAHRKPLPLYVSQIWRRRTA